MSFKELVEETSNISVTQETVDAYIPQAQKKLSHIINREGDFNGERNKPYYLAMIVGEMIRFDMFSDFCSNQKNFLTAK